MKITKRQYEHMTERLSAYRYNLNALDYSLTKKRLSQYGSDIWDGGYVAGYMDALTDLGIDFSAKMDGEIIIKPENVDLGKG